MRIGYITCVIYNTPDNLRIALEDNLIENSAKNSENHKLRINTNTFVQIAQQCNAASYGMLCMYQWDSMIAELKKVDSRDVDLVLHDQEVKSVQDLEVVCRKRLRRYVPVMSNMRREGQLLPMKFEARFYE